MNLKFVKKENDRLNRYAYDNEPFKIYLGMIYKTIFPCLFVLKIKKGNYFVEYHQDKSFDKKQLYDKYFLPTKAAIEKRIAQNKEGK